MEKERKLIRVGSRKSQLALIQTNKIIHALSAHHDDVKFEIVTMTTTGDNILDTALSKIGEKSLFTKELEEALLDERVDFVVHSLKDLPTVLPEGLVIGAVYKRDDPRDAAVMNPRHQSQTLATLPTGSVVGTSSLRRIAQLKNAYPHLEFKDVRGNLNTRLHKLDEGDNKSGVAYDALILAVAGLERMGWGHRITEPLDPAVCMYSVSQGAMAVECRRDDALIRPLLSCLSDNESTVRCTAERSFLKTLEGGCSVPVCVHTTLEHNLLTLRGGVYSIDGTENIVDSSSVQLPTIKLTHSEQTPQHPPSAATVSLPSSALQMAHDLGVTLATKVIKNGAGRILSETKKVMAELIMNEKKIKAMKIAVDEAAGERDEETR